MTTQGELSGKGKRLYTSEQQPRDAEDFYVEPQWCTDLLLDNERFPEPIWDPACGIGTIVKACRDRKMAVVGSDIVLRKRGMRKHDFFGDGVIAHSRNDPARSVITNPPFKLAEAFVDHAFTIGIKHVAVLVQLKFLASQGRYDLFTRRYPPSVVYVLSTRPSMPPGKLLQEGLIEAKGGVMDFCWLVWNQTTVGPGKMPVIRWLLRDKAK